MTQRNLTSSPALGVYLAYAKPLMAFPTALPLNSLGIQSSVIQSTALPSGMLLVEEWACDLSWPSQTEGKGFCSTAKWKSVFFSCRTWAKKHVSPFSPVNHLLMRALVWRQNWYTKEDWTKRITKKWTGTLMILGLEPFWALDCLLITSSLLKLVWAGFSVTCSLKHPTWYNSPLLFENLWGSLRIT